MIRRHICEFVLASDLVPKTWKFWFWEAISEDAPFAWGSNNHGLVRAGDFADYCEERLSEHLIANNRVAVKRWLKRVRAMGETLIDLEN